MRFIMTCGGTGGHIYPAIAIADRIKKDHPNAKVLFIGTKRGMEQNIVPAAGYEIKGIDASGIDRHNLLNNFKTVSNVIKGGNEVDSILKEFKPDFVIGTGGYVTGTVVLHAFSKHIPCYIHEQNAIPGVTNKILENMVKKVFISFEASAAHFKHPEKCILTGNPIRSNFKDLTKDACRKELGIGDEKLILVTGGSLGAQVLNKAAAEFAVSAKDCRILFVSGKRYYEEVKAYLGELSGGVPSHIQLVDYANNMPVLMTAADIVISRAGAIAVSEILACSKPSLLVPSPNVTNNHQYHNAKAVADAGAALLVEEKNIESFSEELTKLLADESRLKAMAENASRIAITDAADKIYELLEL